jgi:hypothetical protein
LKNNPAHTLWAYYCFILFVLGSVFSIQSSAQQQRYNRFQYHKYKWRVFHTKAHVYFPVGYDSLGAFTIRELPTAIKRIKHEMGTTLFKEPNIIIYPSVDQQYESNIGLFEQQAYTFPTFISTGSRIVIAYNGNYSELKDQLYEALAREVWEAQIKEGLTDQVKASEATDKDVPYWFREGAIRYFAHKWPIASEDALKLSFQQNNFQNWEASISYQPRLSGQAFCYFLSENYYPLIMVQLYQQLKKKNLQRSVRLITKKPIDSLFAECFQFYRDRFDIHTQKEDSAAIRLSIPLKRGIKSSIIAGPHGNNIAYTTTKNGERTVWIFDSRSAQTHKVVSYKLVPWLKDHSLDKYPLVQWKDDEILIVTMPVKGRLHIVSYSATGAKLYEDVLYGVDGISHMLPLNEKEYLLSAFRQGQSDIVSYNPDREKYTVYTADQWDDGAFAIDKGNTNELMFVSNRPEKELKLYDSVRLRQVIFTLENKQVKPIVADSFPFAKWDKPTFIKPDALLATTTRSGTERFAVIDLRQPDNVQSLSDYQLSQYLPETSEIILYKQQKHSRNSKDSLIITKQPIDGWINNNRLHDDTAPWLEDYKRREAYEARIDSMLNASKDDTSSFVENILVPKDAKEKSRKRQDSISKSLDYDGKKVRPYVLQLYSAYFSVNVNNDYFINRYQPYLNYQGEFKFPEIGGMVQGGFTDLFENHHVNIAFRVPAGSEGSDFFLKYENTAKKLDWAVSYFRKVETLKPDPRRNWTNEEGKPYPNAAKVKTHYYELAITYPLTYDLSAGFQTAVRQDRTIFLATDKYSLLFEDLKSTWSISTLSLNLIKQQPTIPLLYKGIKGKLLIDLFKGFSQQEKAVLGSQMKIEYAQPVYKYITLVLQAKAGYSKGDNYILYNIAGTDNNVVPKVDSNVHFPQTAPYAFQSLVTPFRGYLQNHLYGNEYALFNADVYFPLFQTLIPIETPLNAINQLQLGIFSDAAAAKETWNKAPVNQGWLWSYGLSARTMLANYSIRLDVAWPGTFSKSPVWYFSINIK